MILPDLLDAAGKAARFQRICDRAMTERRSQEGGIGTLAEKWQHQIVKRYLTENTDEHEVGVEGRRFVSDVRVGDRVYEVQTGEFTPMAEKMPELLYACSILGSNEDASRREIVELAQRMDLKYTFIPLLTKCLGIVGNGSFGGATL